MIKTTGSAGGNSKEADAASAQPKTILQKSYHRLAINQLRLVCLSGGKVKKYKKTEFMTVAKMVVYCLLLLINVGSEILACI